MDKPPKKSTTAPGRGFDPLFPRFGDDGRNTRRSYWLYRRVSNFCWVIILAGASWFAYESYRIDNLRQLSFIWLDRSGGKSYKHPLFPKIS